MMPPAEHGYTTALEIDVVLDRVAKLMATGMGQNEAAREVGVSNPTISRWLRKRAAQNLPESTEYPAMTGAAIGGNYTPGPDAEAAGACPAGEPTRRVGRPAKYDLNGAEIQALRRLYLATGSVELAIEDLATDPNCREETSAAIYAEIERAREQGCRRQWPQSLRDEAIVPESAQDQYRGPKHAAKHAPVDRRGLFWENPESGERVALGAGDLYESDDQSINAPFSYVNPESEIREVGRQTLCSLDVGHSRFLAGQPIGRERDGYRLEDIADHMAGVVGTWGMPRAWRLERGPWENSFVNGVKLPCGTQWGGLGEIFHIIRAWTPGQKGTIETRFRFLQAVMRSAILAKGGLDIGRTRGEHERATKIFLKAASDETAAAKFPDISVMADLMAEAMARCNARPQARRAYGGRHIAADDLLPADWTPRRVPAGQEWRLLPIKARRTIQRGSVEITLPHYPMPFRFRVCGAQEGVWIENRAVVLLAFHPRKLEDGAWIFNGETERSERNPDGMKLGEMICRAPLAEDAPQFVLAGASRDERALRGRRQAAAAMVSAFRGIVPAHASRLVRRVATDEAADGWGNAARVERGELPPSAVLREPTTPAAAASADFTPKRRGGIAPAPRAEIDLDQLAADEAELLADQALF